MLPALAARRGAGALRVWCAACSTGQEPYSLAILMDEIGAGFPGVTLDICASDISERVLEKAQAGLYTQFEVQRGLPISHLIKHFDKADENWQVKPRLRQMIRGGASTCATTCARSAASTSLLPHVLIYFDTETRRRCSKHRAVMHEDGFLFSAPAKR